MTRTRTDKPWVAGAVNTAVCIVFARGIRRARVAPAVARSRIRNRPVIVIWNRRQRDGGWRTAVAGRCAWCGAWMGVKTQNTTGQKGEDVHDVGRGWVLRLRTRPVKRETTDFSFKSMMASQAMLSY